MQVFSLACQVTIIFQCLHGVGQHLLDVHPLASIWGALFYTWLAIGLGLCSLTFSKASIVALILHVTPSTQPKRRIILISIISLYGIVNFIQIVLIWVQCMPLDRVWDRLVSGSCALEQTSNKFSYFQGTLSSGTDLLLAIWPITMVWNLKMSRRGKWAFCGLMAGGILPAAAGIVRMAYSQRLVTGIDVTCKSLHDSKANIADVGTDDLVPFLAWSATEMWFVIILGSVPPLRPLFERVVLRRIRPVSGSAISKSSGSRRTVSRNPQTIGSMGKRQGIETEMTVMVTEEDERNMTEDDEGAILPRHNLHGW